MEKKGGFGKVDINIMSHPELTTTAKCLYACLACYANKERECYPSRETLRKMTGISKTSFDKHMGELVNNGIVTKVQLRKGNLKNGILYKLNDFNYMGTHGVDSACCNSDS